jgi:hypothetical protein
LWLQFTTFTIARSNQGYPLDFTLNVQVIANSATVSPSLFIPVLRMMAVVAFPEA